MNVKKLLKEAQFHGLNKLDDVKCRWTWLMALLCLLSAATVIVAIIVVRFLDRPTYLVRLEKGREYMEFPSVQICPEVLFHDYKIDEFMSRINYPASLNKSYIKSIIQQLAAFYSPDVKYKLHELNTIQYLLDFNNLDVYTASKAMTVTCGEALMRCRLFGQMKNCTELFTLEMSQYGFCCIFNGQSLRSDILKYGVKNLVYAKAEHYTSYVGFPSSLIVAVNQSTPLVNVDVTYKWMSIDGGRAYIDSTLNGTPLSPGIEMWFGHKNEGFHISEDAITLNTELRGCKMTHEALTLFPVYHKKYCLLECEINNLLRRCGCAMVTHPLAPGVQVCRAAILPCAINALNTFDLNTCECVHTCDVDTDHMELSSFQLINHSYNLDPFYDDLDYTKISIVRVFIIKRVVKTKSRRAQFFMQYLVGQLGGIFNVFFGCSLLSIFEIIQILRYAYKHIKENSKKRKWQATNEQKQNKVNNKKVTFNNGIMKNRKDKVKFL